MKLGNHINAHPWLFAGLSALPSCILVAVMVCSCIFAKRVDIAPSAIPNWAWGAAFLTLPVLMGIVGFVLAYCLSHLLEWQPRLITRHLTRGYLVLFVVIWNIVFSYLSGFVFAMGFGDGPAPTSMEKFFKLFKGILCLGFPEAILISLGVCSVVVAIMAAVLEAIVWSLSKIKLPN